MSRTTSVYLASAVVVWAAILAASALILRGTPLFGQLLPILGAGAAWFVVIVPGMLTRSRQR
ncbi:hypothetical protein NET02_04370 [Thermomicrobiaceae bacterium CFH 74404]|uniref:Uncharacterized protein n=1 Tax=Thermalbibacter longus TaxID=2951981 RepID=A0AA41WE61_9BACT|nr:hypothetical protein [Thermalbibacter longus]MCM8748370.1 hypothetical protein [Thermalbibacter longus]